MNHRHNCGLGMGLAAGVFVGLAIGFLYAPRTGKETKALVKERIERAGNRAAEMLYQVKEALGMRLLGDEDYSSSGDL